MSSVGSGVAPIPPSSFASLRAWYKSDVGVTIATGVSAWADQSGLGNTLAQATGSLQPSIANNVIASKPALTFDGVDDFLTVAFALTQPTSVFVVMRPNALVVGRTYVDGGAGANTMAIAHAQVTPNRLRMNAGNSLTGASAMASGTWGITTAIFNGVSSVLATADNADLTGDAGLGAGAGITLGAQFGGTLPANVSVAEVVVLAEAAGAASRAGLRAYFRERYNI